MIITNNEWKTIQKYLPSEISENITNNITNRSFIGKKIIVTMPKYDDYNKTFIYVEGEELNKFWAITPIVEHFLNPHSKYRSITCRRGGSLLISFRSRGKCIEFWNKIKDLDIHREYLKDCTDYEKLRIIVREGRERIF